MSAIAKTGGGSASRHGMIPSGKRMTWAAVLALLGVLVLSVGVAGAELPPGGSFTDDDGLYHERFIEALVAAGISNGCGPDLYCPSKPVNRAEMAALLVRGVEGPGVSLPAYQGYFSDVPKGAWYAGYAERAYQLGIFEGHSNATFRPGDFVWRSDAAILILRALGIEPGSSADGRFTDVSAQTWYAPAVERLHDLRITDGCGKDPLEYCPAGLVTRGQTATFLARALDLAPIIPPPRASMPVSGVVVFPGESIQGAVDAHPAGTSFVIKAGVHRRQSVKPKPGNTFVGESGAVLSGEGVTEFAFGGSVDDVTIRGLVIEKYASPLQKGVIRSLGGADRWLIEGNEIRSNEGIGVKSAGQGWRIVGNYLHHNEQFGLAGGGVDLLVESNEIAFNNSGKTVDAYWAAGGTKWVHAQNLVVRNNYSHDNHGPGLWTDGHNVNTLYEGNRVVNNHHAGIKHEVSCDAVIRNNTVEGNGFGNGNWIAGAGILVANSPDVEVYGNVVRNNNDGIGGIHADRTVSGSPCPVVLKNLWVHDNVIVMNTGHTGIVTNTSDPVFTSWGNRFDRNTYTLGSGQFYKWNGDRSTSEWKNAGQDPNGTWK